MNVTTHPETNTHRDQVQQVLDPLLQARTRLAPVGEFYSPEFRQKPADPRYVFELRKNGRDYSLHTTDASATFTPSVDGDFIYVIKADDPGRIYVAIDMRTGPPELRQYGVEGHTSFGNGSDVLYAGELSFDNGRLVSWDNSSGHYRPSGDARHTNMLPVVRNLLPERLFAVAQKPLTLRLGQRDIELMDLRAMGARVDGRVLWTVAQADGMPSLQHNLENRIQFKSDYLVGQDRSARAAINAEILLEVASVRTSDKPLVIGPSKSRILIDAMNVQLSRFKGVVSKAASGVKSNTLTYLMPGGGIVRQTGVGLQAFGIYNSVHNLSAAIERGDSTETVIQAAGLGAEGASLAAEAAIPALGRYLQAGNVARFNSFAATSFGQRLGGMARLGTNIGRAGGVVGTLMTVPFDIYNAVTSFRQAAQSSGKEAQDHYVNGGLTSVGAGVSFGLGIASAAGVRAAGPAGIVFSLALIAGARIYQSVRYVEDVDAYAGLSAGERFTTGLTSFVGLSNTQEVEDRLAVGRARDAYKTGKATQLQAILKKKNWRAAIFGDAVITPQRPIDIEDNSFLSGTEFEIVNVEQQPAKVIDNAADDSINASAGLNGITNLVRNALSSSETVLWATGDGNDRLLGVLDSINIFSMRRGKKAVRGGEQDDFFMLNAIPGSGSAFDGGEGKDTLVLAGPDAISVDGRPMVNIELSPDDRSWEWDTSPDTYLETDDDGAQHRRRKIGMRVSTTPDAGSLRWGGKTSALRSIENVVTAPNATTSITGNNENNVFVLNGYGDVAGGLGGDDAYIVQGGGSVTLDVGPGNNIFDIKRSIDDIDIWSQSGKDCVMLDFDQGDISIEVVDNSLVVALDDEGDRKEIRFRGQFRTAADGTKVALRNNGDILLWTRDNYALAPLLSKVGLATDGMIECAATRASDPEVQVMDLLIQYAAGVAGTPIGAGAATPGGSMAATGHLLTQAPLAQPSLV